LAESEGALNIKNGSLFQSCRVGNDKMELGVLLYPSIECYRWGIRDRTSLVRGWTNLVVDKINSKFAKDQGSNKSDFLRKALQDNLD
jgi:hypothetical protein